MKPILQGPVERTKV